MADEELAVATANLFSGALLKRSNYLHHWKRRSLTVRGGDAFSADALTLTFVKHMTFVKFKHDEETTVTLRRSEVSVVLLEQICDRKVEREHGLAVIFPFALMPRCHGAGGGGQGVLNGGASGSGKGGLPFVVLGCGSAAARDAWLQALCALLDGGAGLPARMRALSSGADELDHGAAAPAASAPAASAHTASAAATPAAPGEAERDDETESSGPRPAQPPPPPPLPSPAHARTSLRAGRKPAEPALPARAEAATVGSERWRLHSVRDGMRLCVEELAPPHAQPQPAAAPAAEAPASASAFLRSAWSELRSWQLPNRNNPMSQQPSPVAASSELVTAALAAAVLAVVSALVGATGALLLLCALALPGVFALPAGAELGARAAPSARLSGAVRATTAVSASAELVFAAVMATGGARLEWDGAHDGAIVVDALDRHSDVLSLQLPPISLWPFWRARRRHATVLRYWRREADGSYHVLCLPAEHTSAPAPPAGSVRADILGSAITIRPARPLGRGGLGSGLLGAGGGDVSADADGGEGCVVSAVLHLEPRGWLGASWLGAPLFNSLLQCYRLWHVSQLLPLRLYAEARQAESGHGHGYGYGYAHGPAEPPPTFGAEQQLAAAQLIEDYMYVAGNGASAPSEAPSRATLSARDTALRSRRAAGSPPADALERLGSVRRARHGVTGSGVTGAELPVSAHFLTDGRAGGGDLQAARRALPDGRADAQSWDEPAAETFKLRGAHFLTDGRKAPAAAGSTLMELVAVELLRGSSSAPIEHAAARAGSPARAESAANFCLVVNLQVPSTPAVSLVLTWSVAADCAAEHAPLMRRLRAFADAPTDEARNAVFKLVPLVHEGPWIVRRAVGQTPVIVGRALHTSYHRHPDGRYLEVDVDVGSSSVAAGVLRIVRGASRSLVVDLAFLLEGSTVAELPERPLATARLICLDLDLAAGDAHCHQASSAVHAETALPAVAGSQAPAVALFDD